MDLPPEGRVQWEPPSVERVAELLPDTEILCILGYGGMGAVYKARQRALGRLVAIKLLPPEVSCDEGYRRRFLREAQLMAHLTHPRIVGLHEAGATKEGDYLYIIMEYVEGEPLYALIQERRITPRQTGRILADVCEGLAYAHAKGVIHRDIKPGNVLVDAEGRGKIADFGVGRWSEPGLHDGTTRSVFGTRDYLAPELLERREGDHRVDIYALGVMLYEMLCFELPRGHFQPPSQRVGTGRAIDRVVATAMQPLPERRYATVAEMGQALAQARWPRTSGAAWRRWRIGASALLVATLAGGAIWVVARDSEKSRVIAAAPPPVSEATPAPPPPRVPVAVPVTPVPPRATAALAPPAAITKGWHEWLAEGEPMPEGLEKSGAGYVPARPGVRGEFFMVSPPLRDQALRVTFEQVAMSAQRPLLRLLLRTVPEHDEYYFAVFQVQSWQIMQHERGGHEPVLQMMLKPPASRVSGPQTMEFRAIGNELTLLNNGEMVARAPHKGFAEGSAGLLCGSGIRLLKVEWCSVGE